MKHFMFHFIFEMKHFMVKCLSLERKPSIFRPFKIRPRLYKSNPPRILIVTQTSHLYSNFLSVLTTPQIPLSNTFLLP